MKGWRLFYRQVIRSGASPAAQREAAGADFERYQIYPDSIQQHSGSIFFIAREGLCKNLVVIGESPLFDRFSGAVVDLGEAKARICEMDPANCRLIQAIFPFTRPSSHKGRATTIGLGDRLGLASAGHIRLVRNYDVFPVLAQQSIRELNLTGRTYEDVLAAAAWAVFQEGYAYGYGADGDHLKTAAEVEMALGCGVTMITLDCSEQIRNEVTALDDQAVAARYADLPVQEREVLEEKFLNRVFSLGEATELTFEPADLRRIVLLYRDAITHTGTIFHQLIKPCPRPIDFELSIDETLTATSACAHFLVASLLLEQGVEIASLAPRFCGEFQKGIDYIGNLSAFAEDFTAHDRIARFFGYKISIHSGSDKFSVFPIIGARTQGLFHLKTAGTNWLEAVRVVAVRQPSLYRAMHQYALEHLDEAKRYYHIGADPSRIPPLDQILDCDLPDLMNQDDARQLMHITYGILLKAMKADGSSLFRDDFYQVLAEHENAYMVALDLHIGRHLDQLGLTCRISEVFK